MYTELNKKMASLLSPDDSLVTNLSNASALLNEYLDDINWVGFYYRKGGKLLLGPFQGKVACVTIPMGRGVCGTAAEKAETVVVADVHQFPGHIACDCASNSEIVIPIFAGEEVVGVLDIDSPSLNRFSDADKNGLEPVAKAIGEIWKKAEKTLF